jgi:hypothetical protein
MFHDARAHPGLGSALALILVCAAPALAQPADDRFDLAVTGGQLTLERLSVRPEERGTALVLLARALYGVSAMGASGSMAITLTEMFGPVTIAPTPPANDGPSATVLAPFSERTWQAVLRPLPGIDLFSTILRHRGALLVAAGALQSTPEVRRWLGQDIRLLEQIVTQWPGAFAQAAPGLDLSGQTILVPGGSARESAWTALVGAPPSRPEEFLRRLLARDDGRLARFYAVMARQNGARLSAALQPLQGENATTALAGLYERAKDADAPGDANLHPFQLSYADLSSVLHSLNDLPLDALPVSAGLWPTLLSQSIDNRDEAAALVRSTPSPSPYAATIRAMLGGAPRRRRDHLAVIALARRLWTGNLEPGAQADLVYALGQFPRYRALLLVLDRMDVKAPAVWARSIDAARRVESGGGGPDRELRLSAFQGAMALVERARLVGSLGLADTEKVLLALGAVVDSETPAPAAVRSWLLETFIPALPLLARPDRFSGKTAYESRVLQALAGVPLTGGQPFRWEGLDYTVDVMAGEHERIVRIREQLPSPGLDAALDGNDPATLVAALRAMVYAPALGDPEGAVTLSPDVVTRHDFGGSRTSPGRDVAWLPAIERTGTGGPWHVGGSLFGLDLALSRSALRRLSADEMPAVPTINLNDQLTLARTAAALASARFDDATRDELAAAMARGQQRVAEAGATAAALLALGDEVGMTTADRQSLSWTLASMPQAGAQMFGLRDLLWLGRPQVEPAVLARWGVISEPVDGRLGTRFDAPVPWDHLAGRPDTGVLATQVPDLTLRLVQITAEKQVPAALIPALLLFATQDYWHDVEARFADDWSAMARGAKRLPATRVEDYTAALASGGPLRPR